MLTEVPKQSSVNRPRARGAVWGDSISLLLALVPGDIRHTGDIDETFFGLPILVMVELSSGYIFTEVSCSNRTYETWAELLQSWWTQTGWHCHFLVSDGAKALIKLALSELGCASVADLFHALRALGQPLGSAAVSTAN